MKDRNTEYIAAIKQRIKDDPVFREQIKQHRADVIFKKAEAEQGGSTATALQGGSSFTAIFLRFLVNRFTPNILKKEYDNEFKKQTGIDLGEEFDTPAQIKDRDNSEKNANRFTFGVITLGTVIAGVLIGIFIGLAFGPVGIAAGAAIGLGGGLVAGLLFGAYQTYGINANLLKDSKNFVIESAQTQVNKLIDKEQTTAQNQEITNLQQENELLKAKVEKNSVDNEVNSQRISALERKSLKPDDIKAAQQAAKTEIGGKS